MPDPASFSGAFGAGPRLPASFPAPTIPSTRRPLGVFSTRRWVAGWLTFPTLLVCLGIQFTLPARADFHVAPGGDDSAPGTLERPFASFEAARDAVRKDRAAGRISGGGVSVWIAAGDYPRTQSLELTELDSGTPDAPVVWRSRGEDRVRWLGGRPLRGFEPVTDASILSRLDPAARGAVRQLNLKVLGIQDYGTMQSRGFGRAVAPAHCELFHGGLPMTLARWPNEGEFERIAGFPETTGKGDDHGGKIGDLATGFFYAGERPNRWREVGEAWVHGYWAWDWANSYERIASIDRDRRLVITAPPHGLYGFRKGQRFYFLNLLEELDRPGEWFLDRNSGMLYFWPPEARVNAAAGLRSPELEPETLLSLLDRPLVRVVGASNVVFEGLAFEAGRSHAIEIRGGAAVRVVGCLLRNLGNNGVVISGGRNHGVESCDLFDTGDGGVSLSGGDRKRLEGAGHYVQNSHFQRQGRWSKCYVPAISLEGVGLRASQNLIHDHPHCAILYWGNDHRMEFNEIHHIALETGDVGAIYTGRDYSFRGNQIVHNFIHHTGGVGMGSMGVYMDDCVSGTEIRGNVFHEVQRAAFLGGGRDHRVENNVFVDCNHAVELDGRGLDASPVWRGMVDDTMRRRLDDIPLELYRKRYPELRTLDAHYGAPGTKVIAGSDFKGVPPEGNHVTRNVCVGKWLRVGWNARSEWLGLERNFTEGDPGFTRTPGPGSRAVDFALRPDSPVWALGFEPIPVERIGLQPDAHRRKLSAWGRP